MTVSRSVTPTAQHELWEGLKKKKIKVFKLARHRTSLYGADRLLLIATLNCWRNFDVRPASDHFRTLTHMAQAYPTLVSLLLDILK